VIVSRIFVALIGAVALASCSGNSPRSNESRDVLVISGDVAQVSTFDPAIASDDIGRQTALATYDRLVTRDAVNSTVIVPSLAESWTVSPDGKRWVFKIRQGPFFASKSPVTADDVQYSVIRAWRKGAQGKVELSQLGVTDASVDTFVTVIDDRHVAFHFDKAYLPPIILSLFAHRTMSVVDAKLLRRVEKEGDLGSGYLRRKSAGSGPFRVAHWAAGRYAMLDRQPYFGRQPSLRRIIFQHMPEPSSAAYALRRQDIDVATRLPDDALEGLADVDTIHIERGPVVFANIIMMNTAKAPLNDVRVRRALRYLIDYSIMTKLGRDSQVESQSLLQPFQPGYRDRKLYQQNIAQAKKLLAQAGVKSGTVLPLRATENGIIRPILEKFQQNAGLAGLRIALSFEPPSSLYPAIRGREYTLAYARNGLSIEVDGVLTDFGWNPTVNDKMMATFGPAFETSWSNQEASGLIDRGRVETDPALRAKLYARVDDILQRDSSTLVLSQEKPMFPMRKSISGLRFSDGIPMWAWVRKDANGGQP
jgi:peptide/nickel transport system substrate-binding protein